MSIGDIICIRFNRPHGHADAKVLTVFRSKVEDAFMETFILEFIAGPLDGERITMTRAQLDANQARESGGDDWKA